MKEELERIFGKNVSLERDDCLVYSYDASRINGKASVVVWPEDKGQIVRLVKKAKEKGWDIVPRGSGTGMSGGCVPKDSVVIDLSKMDKIGEIDGETVTVEPGVILDNLNYFLKDHDLYFPVRPSSHRACSIGGMISTNASGNRAIRFGKTDDWVEEITIVDGNGNEMLLKGDGLKEFAGTEGILGIIVSAKLRLTEPIRNRSISVFNYDNIDDLLSKVNELKGNGNINAIEFRDRLCSKLAGHEPKYNLFVEFSDDSGEIRDEKEIMKAWNNRESVGTKLSTKGYIFMEDPMVPVERVKEFIRWLESRGIPSFGHIGTGIIHQRYRKEDLPKVREMLARVKEMGGNVSGEHGIGISKREYLDREVIGKIRDLKKRYDPYNIFNRGKVI